MTDIARARPAADTGLPNRPAWTEAGIAFVEATLHLSRLSTAMDHLIKMIELSNESMPAAELLAAGIRAEIDRVEKVTGDFITGADEDEHGRRWRVKVGMAA